MKYPWIPAALASLILSYPLSNVTAEDQATPPPAAQKSQGQGWNNKAYQKKLGLTDEQTAKMEALRKSLKETLKPLLDNQRGLMKTLAGQVKTKASDADIQKTLDNLKTNRLAMRDEMEKFQSQKSTILTPTQQAQLLLVRGRRFARAHPKGKGPDPKDQEQESEDDQR